MTENNISFLFTHSSKRNGIFILKLYVQNFYIYSRPSTAIIETILKFPRLVTNNDNIKLYFYHKILKLKMFQTQ